jgi:hypothetical protein
MLGFGRKQKGDGEGDGDGFHYEVVGTPNGTLKDDEFVVTVGELRQIQGVECDGKTDHYPIVVKYEAKV